MSKPRFLDDAAGRRRPRWTVRAGEAVVTTALCLCALFSIGVTITTIVVLVEESSRFFGLLSWREGTEATAAGSAPVTASQVESVSPWEFFTGTSWQPTRGRYGVLPLVFGTGMVTVIAMAVAVPLGLVLAIWLSEYAPRAVREVVKPALEILAGIPTVVFGFFALEVVTPGLRTVFGNTLEFHNALSAGLMVGLLCVPLVCSLSEDALSAVRRELREAALGLGATRLEATFRVVVPAALSGIVSAVLLAIARAVGETMVVTLAAGATARFTVDPRTSINTMTGYIAQTTGSDVSRGEFSYYSIYAVALTLFLIVFSITILGNLIRRRYREA